MSSPIWSDSFTVKLPSSSEIDSGLTKVSISKGDCKAYVLPRIAFHSGKYVQRFSKTELEMLYNGIRLSGVDSLETDSSLTKNLVFHRLRNGSAILLNIDATKVFGVRLQKSEMEDLRPLENIFIFLLDYMKANEEVLKDLVMGTFIYIIYPKVMNKLHELCEQCQEKSPVDKNHFCHNLGTNLSFIEKIIEEICGDQDIAEKLDKRFKFLIENLLISKNNQEHLVRFINQLGDKKAELAQQIFMHRDFGIGRAKIVEGFWDALDNLPEKYAI